MSGRPEAGEAAPYYFKYVDLVPGDDVVGVLEAQLADSVALLRGFSEERSLHRYAPGKWSVRQVLNHVNDAERVFLSRAFWFARGFESALPSFDEQPCADAARADAVAWARHVEEFRAVRQASVAFFRNLPAEAWRRAGVASGSSFSVRVLAYILAGHLAHHTAILRERYF